MVGAARQRKLSAPDKNRPKSDQPARNRNSNRDTNNEPMQLPPAQGATSGQSNGFGTNATTNSSSNSSSFRRDPQAHLLFRTKMCKFYQMGACTRGPQCGFAHDDEVLRATPDLKRTSLCPQLMKYGGCDKGDSCTYAHSKSELRSVEPRNPKKKASKETKEAQTPQGVERQQSQQALMFGNKLNTMTQHSRGSAGADSDGGPSWRNIQTGTSTITRSNSGICMANMTAKDTPAKLIPTQPVHDDIPDEIRERRTEFLRTVMGLGSDEAVEQNFVPNPLKAPFSSPRRVPQTELFNTPNFSPTSPPWRPLSPSFDESDAADMRPRFGSGSIVVKNTFLEIVNPGPNDGGQESPALRRVSTWGGNLSEVEQDETKGLDSFDSTTISSVASDEEDEGRVKNPTASRDAAKDGRLRSGGKISIVLSGFDDE